MQLNHLSLAVPDVAQTRAFFETFFRFQCTAVKGKEAVAVLEGKPNFILVLTQEDTPAYPADFHIGFMLNTPEEVRQTHQKLLVGGIQAAEPKLIRNTLTFYFQAPGNFMVEVGCPGPTS